jgi:hypothetical protein
MARSAYAAEDLGPAVCAEYFAPRTSRSWGVCLIAHSIRSKTSTSLTGAVHAIGPSDSAFDLALFSSMMPPEPGNLHFVLFDGSLRARDVL